MMNKKISLAFALEGLLCGAYVLLGQALPSLFGTLFTFPFRQIGLVLRALSVSGWLGNGISIALYVLFCLTPIGLLIRKKQRHWEDALLVLLSMVLFPVMYLMENPQMQALWLGQVYQLMGGELVCMVVWSVIIGYALLMVMRKCATARQSHLIDLAPRLMFVYCAVLVFQVFGNGLDSLLANLDAFRQANNGTLSGLELTCVFLVAQYLVDSLPDVLFCGVLLKACGILELLQTEGYTGDLIAAADNLSRRCGMMLIMVVLSNVFFNLIQLLYIRELHNARTVVRMPLDILVLVVGMLLIARFIRSHKKLKDENDSFI